MNSSDFASKKLKGRDVSAAPRINNYNNSGSTKEAQKCRTLLPICEADAPLFLSAVYNKRYTSEKITSRCPQSGRSMIEMLGVLAIIGVLSVGGIAGYSKAMIKYRVNKTIEQISQISQNIRTFYSSQKNYNGAYNEKILKKAKLVPDEMWHGYDEEFGGDYLTNAWGGMIQIVPWNKQYEDENKDGETDKTFHLDVYPIPQDACIELASIDWTSAASGVIAIAAGEQAIIVEAATMDGDGDVITSSGYRGVYATIKGPTISIPMDLSVAADACSYCGDSCEFAILFE